MAIDEGDWRQEYFVNASTRPPRCEPPLEVIASFWLNRDDWPDYIGNFIGLGEPFCARCEWLAPVMDTPDVAKNWKAAGKYLDRAHLIDRCYSGLDVEPNLVPLCHRCHETMPSFAPGQELEALDYVKDGRTRSAAWQMITDECGTDGPRAVALLLEVSAMSMTSNS